MIETPPNIDGQFGNTVSSVIANTTYVIAGDKCQLPNCAPQVTGNVGEDICHILGHLGSALPDSSGSQEEEDHH